MDYAYSDYHGGQLVATAVTFLVLTYFAVFLRCFVRLVITKAFALEDWLMLAAQVHTFLPHDVKWKLSNN
jgi:hypothetical protein